MSDYERQFQADLERAQALSLESLALEQFRRQRNISEKSTDGSSIHLNDSVDGRPPPALPPPPRRPSRQSSRTSCPEHQPVAVVSGVKSTSNSPTRAEVNDLISFTSPKSKTNPHDTLKDYIEQIHKQSVVLVPANDAAMNNQYPNKNIPNYGQMQNINYNYNYTAAQNMSSQRVPYPNYSVPPSERSYPMYNAAYPNNAGGATPAITPGSPYPPSPYNYTRIAAPQNYVSYPSNSTMQPPPYSVQPQYPVPSNYAFNIMASARSPQYVAPPTPANNSFQFPQAHIPNVPSPQPLNTHISDASSNSKSPDLFSTNVQHFSSQNVGKSHSVDSTTTIMSNSSRPDFSRRMSEMSNSSEVSNESNDVLANLPSSMNLIDLGNKQSGSNAGNVRVSVLEAFDPLMIEQNNTVYAGASEGSSSVYDEFDPLDFLYGDTQLREMPVYATINKRDSLQPTYPSPPPKSIQPMPSIVKKSTTNKLYDCITVSRTRNYDSELVAFLDMVKEIRAEHNYKDAQSNPGYVIAARSGSKYPPNTSIKLLVYHTDPEHPVTFTSDVESTVEHVIMHIVCEVEGEISDTDEYMLRVWGVNEYLTPGSSLCEYDYVRLCVRLEKDVLLCLQKSKETSVARTERDDVRDNLLSLDELMPNQAFAPLLSFDNLSILLETLEGELSKAVGVINAEGSCPPNGVFQAVKAICALAGHVETLHISKTLADFSAACSVQQAHVGLKPEIVSENGQYCQVAVRRATAREVVAKQCQRVRDAVRALLAIYCRTQLVDFQLSEAVYVQPCSIEKAVPVGRVHETALFCVEAVHRLPPCWNHDEFMFHAQIYHGTRPLKNSQTTVPTHLEHTGFYPRIVFDTWLTLDEIPISSIPREARLVLTLYGRTVKTEENTQMPNAETRKAQAAANAEKGQMESADNVQFEQEELGWTAIQLFDYDGILASGNYILPLWPVCADRRLGSAPHPMHTPVQSHATVNIEIPLYTNTGVRWQSCDDPRTATGNEEKQYRSFETLDSHTQLQLVHLIEQGAYQRMPIECREILWEKRQYLLEISGALPLVLLSATSWDMVHRNQLLRLVRQWSMPSPLNAMHLLLPCFPDHEVRELAVGSLQQLSSDALCEILPQLVAAVRHEAHHAGSLARLLLSRALQAPPLAHRLYWLLVHALPGVTPQNTNNEFLGISLDENNTQTSSDVDASILMSGRWSQRYQLILRALLAIVGENISQKLLQQQLLVKHLSEIANAVKTCKEGARNRTLVSGVEQLAVLVHSNKISLPLSLGMEVHDVDVKSCTYFASNTLPLKINFIGKDNAIVPAMFKVGDDLRQDSLVLQVMRVMDSLWLKEGLDLRMVTFQAIPTQLRKGMIEIVTEAETLRAIQTEWGLTGSFKDRPIAEWLAKHNPSELEYERARDNFTASCAGYSVATYLLGICDRHNDNIMLKTSGHLFHIDFGKFLGDAQMFGNFKRDRAPFVLTPDMAYVINGGERPNQRFQYFVELCCMAFNIVRRHHDHMLDLFALMATSGVAGVTMSAVNYVRAALLPGASQAEAAAAFARLIHSSLKNKFTPINFFLHNLAQLRATVGETSNTSELLSFMPRTYTMAQDGRLTSVEVLGYEKRYDPEKHYVYALRIYRQGQATPFTLYRSYKHFTELYQKICVHFPLAKVHSLPTGLHVGRSNIRQVAERRSHDVQAFLASLFVLADEIAHSDLVYTFFHPLLRDQQDAAPQRSKNKTESEIPEPSGSGSIKISVQYSAGVLSVLILHAQSLALTPQGLPPNPYVKVYLVPDPSKETKRKTRVLKRNSHPSFMEMLEYRLPYEVVVTRNLQATVWNYDSLQENQFLGGVVIPLNTLPLREETVSWYPLEYIPR